MWTSEASLIIRLHLWKFFSLPGLHIWWSWEPQAVTLHSVGNLLFISLTVLNFTQQRREITLNWKHCCTDITIISAAEVQKEVLHINKTSVSIFLVYCISLKHLDARPILVMTPQVTSLRGAHDLPFMSWQWQTASAWHKLWKSHPNKLTHAAFNCLVEIPKLELMRKIWGRSVFSISSKSTFYTGSWVSVG